MHEFVSFNYEIFHSNQVKISGISSASLYGSGVFTTVAVYNSSLFLWEKHWRRLTENAARLQIYLAEFSEEKVKKALLEILIHNKVINGRVRLTFFDESSTELWQTESQTKTSLLITTGNFRESPLNLHLTISPYRINSTSPLVNTKSTNYLENILALREAKQRSFNEAIRVNEKDEIVSACMANIFFIKGHDIFTPSLETGALQGTTREFILDNFNVHECKVRLAEFESAESIYLTSTGLKITNVSSLNTRKYKISSILETIKEVFKKATETIK